MPTLNRQQRDVIRLAAINPVYGNAVVVNGAICFVSRRAVKHLRRQGLLEIVRRQYTGFFSSVKVFALTTEGKRASEALRVR